MDRKLSRHRAPSTEERTLCLLETIDRRTKKLMSIISDYIAKQEAWNGRIATGLDGISTDVDALNAKITELQNSPDAVTPADQARIDALVTAGEALATRVEGLDAQHPPKAPANS